LSRADGQPETIVNQCRFARTIAFVHGPNLGHGDVAFIHKNEKIFGEIIQQRRRWLAGQTAGEVPGIVLDAVAVTNLLDHFQIEERALFDALGSISLFSLRK
jgi:hypothetical protein